MPGVMLQKRIVDLFYQYVTLTTQVSSTAQLINQETSLCVGGKVRGVCVCQYSIVHTQLCCRRAKKISVI